MATAEVFCSHSHIDLENGAIAAPHRRRRSTNPAYDAQEEDGSLCFSDAEGGEEEEDDDHSTYSSYSQFYSTTGGSIDGYSFAGGGGGAGGWSSRRVSSASDLSVAVDASLAEDAVEIKVHSGKVEKICRICHLSLAEDGGGSEEFGVPIELGCSCKDDLGTAHKHCAETWFKIKGNKICEICNCTARNVVGPNENADTTQNSNENASSAGEPSAVAASPEPHRFWQGNRLLNFLLACMVFAFVISWLFHFKVPS
ncbi:hypothetical protein V2J09_010515 [Rumex salicifolius]